MTQPTTEPQQVPMQAVIEALQQRVAADALTIASQQALIAQLATQAEGQSS